MEGFWGILQSEMYDLNLFETYEEPVKAMKTWIPHYHCQQRQHKRNCLAPINYRSAGSGAKKQDPISEILEKIFLFFVCLLDRERFAGFAAGPVLLFCHWAKTSPQRSKIVAVWARVAVSLGFSLPSMPFNRPLSTAQVMAGTA